MLTALTRANNYEMGFMMQKADMLKKLERINDLPTLPAIAMEVNRMLQDEFVKMEDLEGTIEKDQAMTSKILRLSNSAFFGLRFKVRSIREALMLIGFNTVRNAVVSVSVIKAFDGLSSLKEFNMAEFWEHSIAVAITGKELARQSGLAQPDDAFLAGLLHDIGKIVLIQYFPDVFKEIWERMTSLGEIFHEAEARLQTADHGLMGGVLAQKWKIHDSIAGVIRYHSRPSKSCPDYDLVLVVHLANVLANAFRKKDVDRRYLLSANGDAMDKMKSLVSSLSDWYPAVRSEIREASQFFLEKE